MEIFGGSLWCKGHSWRRGGKDHLEGHLRGVLLWRVESCKHPSDILKSETGMCCFSAAFTHLVNVRVESGDTDEVQGRKCR